MFFLAHKFNIHTLYGMALECCMLTCFSTYQIGMEIEIKMERNDNTNNFNFIFGPKWTEHTLPSKLCGFFCSYGETSTAYSQHCINFKSGSSGKNGTTIRKARELFLLLFDLVVFSLTWSGKMCKTCNTATIKTLWKCWTMVNYIWGKECRRIGRL